MEESGQKKGVNKKVAEVRTFQVPFAIEVIKENINITTNTSYKAQLINQAFIFHGQGNISEAVKYYKLFINKGYQDHRVYTNFGAILQNIGNLQEAEFYTRKAIKLKPDFANPYYNLGNILKDLRKLEEAELSTKKAIELQPTFANAHYNLGNILRELGKLKDAEISMRKAIELNPDLAGAYSNLGIILKDLGKSQDAERLLRKAIALNSDLAEAHSNLGSILIDYGKLEEAEILLRKAIKLKPDLAEAHANLGILLRDLDHFKEAELATYKAIQLEPDWEKYFLYAGCIFERKAYEIVKNNLLEAKSLTREKHQKSYINAALKATDIAKKSKSGINKGKDKLILNRKKEDELISYLYCVKNRELNNTIDARYGKGFCSQDLHFFNDQSPTISKLSDDIKKICKEELGLKEIFICESFFNIFKSGSLAGAKSHNHIGKKDSSFGLSFHKYSLIYYLEIGDQTGEDPGILRLYEPYEEILPTNNMLVIIGAERNHSVSYSGKKDRVVLSANFYGF